MERKAADIEAEARAGQQGPAATASPHAHHYILDAANYGRCNRCRAERQFHPENSAWEHIDPDRLPDPDRPLRRTRGPA